MVSNHELMASTPEQVAGEAPRKRRNRKRTRNATIQRRIHARSEERQRAWTETDQADLTDALTRKLGHDFEGLRASDREAIASGAPEGTPYRGKTAKAGTGG